MDLSRLMIFFINYFAHCQQANVHKHSLRLNVEGQTKIEQIKT